MVNSGEYLCIVGANGSGKSTLIKTLLGLNKNFTGTISKTQKISLGYLPQQTLIQRDFPASVFEVVLSGTLSRKKIFSFYTKEDKKIALENMNKLGISHLVKSSFKELSGGQQQRVLLARALCSAKDLLILDEPVTGLDPSITDELYELIKINDNNKIILSLVSNYLNYDSTYINKKMIDIFKKNIDNNITNEDAYKLLLIDLFSEQVDSKYYSLIREYIINEVKKVNMKEYLNNPYYLNMKANNITQDSWKLLKQNYQPYEGFIYNFTKDYNNFVTYPSLGFFEKEFSYLTVLEKNREWMAVKPNEIETMKEPINDASGNVLTFGLGLGYFAYMASLKEDVTSVTIVEKDEKVINLFKKNLLPNFTHKEKINIINEDAFLYYSRINDNEYNFIFIDIWHDVSDGIYSYLKFKNNENKFKTTKIEYWIEKEILLFLRTIIINLLKEVNDGINPLNVQSKNQDIDNLYK